MKILVIHGNTNRKHSLNEDSKSRCDTAKTLIFRGCYDRIMTTGGVFEESQCGISIARAMRDYLESQWIEEHIYVEDQSLTTIHNVELSMETIKPEDEVIVITSNYHVFRTWLIWLLIGKKFVRVVSAKSQITLKKLFVEFVGIGVTTAYAIGIKWPELYFRAKARTIKTVD